MVVTLRPTCLFLFRQCCEWISGLTGSTSLPRPRFARTIPRSAWASNSRVCPKTPGNGFRLTWISSTLAFPDPRPKHPSKSRALLPTFPGHPDAPPCRICILWCFLPSNYRTLQTTGKGGLQTNEDWDHLLSHLRRQRGSGHGTWPGAGAAWSRNSFHLLRPAHPAARPGTQHSLPRSRSLALSAVRLSAVRSGAGYPDGRGRAALRSRLAARALLHSALCECSPGTTDVGR